MTAAERIRRKAENLAALNTYLETIPPIPRKRTILALHGFGLLSEVAANLLIEFHELEAV